MPEGRARRSAGRPRSDKARQAILTAALQLAREDGYANLTIERIADRAGVGKTTIYRWWRSKGAVVLDALEQAVSEVVEAPDTGDIRTDLEKQVGQIVAVLSDPDIGHHIAGLVGEAQHDKDLAVEFHKRVVQPRRAAVLARLALAQTAGQLSPSVNLDLLADTLFAPIWFRLLIRTAPLDEINPAQLVNQILHGATGKAAQ